MPWVHPGYTQGEHHSRASPTSLPAAPLLSSTRKIQPTDKGADTQDRHPGTPSADKRTDTQGTPRGDSGSAAQ